MILGRVNLIGWVERSETHGAASVAYAASPLTHPTDQSGTTAVVSISSLAAGSTRRVTATKAIAG